MKLTEQNLAERIRKRDNSAMKALYDQYAGYLTAVCSRYIDNKEDIRDLMQESFIRIFSSIGSFEYRGEGSLKAWMSRIVTNNTLKHIRDNINKGLISIDDDIPDIPDEDIPEISDIPPSVIQEMIKKLPEGYRTVFNLFVFEEKTHKEIAGLLGIKENSSASQLHRAKALLAGWINEYRQTH
ncbi:MAG: RNA polymerase sigma factor [Candidatus Cryptobacteroides sp.]